MQLRSDIAALAELTGIGELTEHKRRELLARVREAASSDEAGTRTLLASFDVCDGEERFQAMSLIEALATAPSKWLDLLIWYVDVAAKSGGLPGATLGIAVLELRIPRADGGQRQVRAPSGIHRAEPIGQC
jgi:hypothetical protein